MNTDMTEHCPRCKSATDVVQKMLTIGTPLNNQQRYARENNEGYKQTDTLTADQIKDECFIDLPTRQFVNGFYCNHCGIGFIPDAYLK